MSTLAERCAEYAVGMSFYDLPHDVVDTAVDCLVDTLGAALTGVIAKPSAGVRATVASLSSTGASTALGCPHGAAAALAALVNGTSAHALEMDDTDKAGLCHPGAVVVPAAFAVAEEEGATGPELLAAIVVGYELTVRMARWVNPQHRLRGFHTTGTVPTMGAAAAVARLRRLSVADTARAIGIAGSFTGGLFEFVADGSTVKRVHAGRAGMSAVLSADLARAGITGPLSVLEGRYGFYRAHTGDSTVPELPIGDLGSRHVIREVGRKPYPCCRFCHASIDAALVLHDQWRASPSAAVRVMVSRLCADQTGAAYPESELDRQFSTPYGVALALLRGRLLLTDYTTDPDLEALQLAGEIVVDVDEDIAVDDRISTVSLTYPDGRVEDVTVEAALGEPVNPLSSTQLTAKFRDLASTVLSTASAESLLRTLRSVQGLTRLDPISDLLARAGDNGRVTANAER